jgi:cob(I)alamin adenosyltransferase
MLEQHEEDMQEQYEAQQIEWMQFDVDNYIDFLNKSNETVTKTKDSALTQLHDLVTVRQNFLENFQYLHL